MPEAASQYHPQDEYELRYPDLRPLSLETFIKRVRESKSRLSTREPNHLPLSGLGVSRCSNLPDISQNTSVHWPNPNPVPIAST